MDILKMENGKEKEKNIMKKEIQYIMVIILMVMLMAKEYTILKMDNIILENLKMG